MYPPLHLIEGETERDCFSNLMRGIEEVGSEVVQLPAWLIEPPAEEIQRIAFAG
jgi:hypothetical protein